MYCVFREKSEQQYISLIKGENMKKQNMFTKEYAWRGLMTAGGLLVIAITICIGAFLIYKGSGTFTIFGHSIFEFLGSTDWNPEDNAQGGGTVGALIFIVGSLCTCGLALLIATPFAVGSAIFMIEIAPKFGEKFYRPIVEIFAGIPSVVYGWVGLTVLIPAIKKVFHLQVGHSVLAAGIVLALMIFPTISNVAADSIHSVPKDYRMAAYGLGSTRWQSIYKVVIPAAGSGILSGIILGLARAFGEALAVAMVIGQTTALPKGLFSTTKSLTTEIAAQMGNATEGGEMKTALWTMALLLFLLSLLFILLIHYFSRPKSKGEQIDESSTTCAWNKSNNDRRVLSDRSVLLYIIDWICILCNYQRIYRSNTGDVCLCEKRKHRKPVVQYNLSSIYFVVILHSAWSDSRNLSGNVCEERISYKISKNLY